MINILNFNFQIKTACYFGVKKFQIKMGTVALYIVVAFVTLQQATYFNRERGKFQCETTVAPGIEATTPQRSEE